MSCHSWLACRDRTEAVRVFLTVQLMDNVSYFALQSIDTDGKVAGGIPYLSK